MLQADILYIICAIMALREQAVVAICLGIALGRCVCAGTFFAVIASQILSRPSQNAPSADIA